jgi:flagella basal body P-ring formation protein FlgA
VVLAGLSLVAARADLRATDAPTTAAVKRAVGAAVVSRLGEDVDVVVQSMDAIRVTEGAEALLATPDVSARTGQPARFALSARTERGRTRVGEVTALVRASAEVVRTTHPISRGSVIEAGDIEARREELTGVALRPVLTRSTVVGAKTTRDLPAGVAVGANDIVAEPLVKNGTTVRALIRVGAVEIEADVLAMDAGARGDIIRVTNTASRRVFRARVAGEGRVEVLEP